MQGMTLKQFHRHEFIRLLGEYREAKKKIHTPDGALEFVALSVLIHAAKAHVPKSWWRQINRDAD